MKRYALLILLFIVVLSNNLLAFDISKMGIRMGSEFNLETYFVTSWGDDKFDSRGYDFDGWNGRFEAFYRIHKNINIGLLFKTMKISEKKGKLTEFTLGTIGISSEYTYHWKNFSAFAGFSLGSWVHLSDEKWVEQKPRFSSEVRGGIGYRFLNQIGSQVYVNRDFIYYNWWERFSEDYTWWYMWSVGISFTFHLF